MVLDGNQFHDAQLLLKLDDTDVFIWGKYLDAITVHLQDHMELQDLQHLMIT